MASKLKETQLRRKEQYERKLKNRLAILSEKKIDPARADKDPLVKNLRANIDATDARLKAIAKIEQRTAELAKIKADKAEQAAALRKAPEAGKEKEKEKGKDKEAKKVPAEGKEKKKKKEAKES